MSLPLRAGTIVALAIVLLAAALRFASLDYDLDLGDPRRTLLHNHTDARGMVMDVLGALERRDLEPNDYLYRGPGSFLVFGTADVVVLGVQALAHPRGWEGVLFEARQNPAVLALVHRGVSALAGTLAVLFLMRLARRELGAPAAACAGLVLACAYLHVRDSHFGTADALWTLSLVLALDACLRLRRDPSARRHGAAGLWIGIAVAMKYFSVVLLLHLAAAHWSARRAALKAGRAPPSAGRLFLAAALVPLGFVLLFPGLLSGSLESLKRHVFYGAESLSPDLDGWSQLALLRFHLEKTLAVGLGEPVFLAALAGLVLAWRRPDGGRFLVFSVLGIAPTLFLTAAPVVRYGLGLLVVLALPAGLALAELWARVPRVLGALVLLGTLAPGVARALAHDLVWQRGDTRVQLASELYRRCAPQDEVLAVGLAMEQPYFLGRPPFRYRNYRFSVARAQLTLAEIHAAPPRWMLWGDLPRQEGEPELEELTRTRYREVLRLENQRTGYVEPTFRTVPRALGVPYEKPWSVSRPGPELVLYQRND